MLVSRNDVIGEIAVKNYDTAKVFQNFGINFCCDGGRTIEQVCLENSIKEEALLKSLNEKLMDFNYTLNFFEAWDIDLLVDYLERKHKKIEFELVPQIKQYFDQFRCEDRECSEVVEEFKNVFSEASDSLMAHMSEEHQTTFPLIKRMYLSERKKKEISFTEREQLLDKINLMVEEHREEGNHLVEIRKLIHNYERFTDCSPSIKNCIKRLWEYCSDLELHIHIENNLLFPKVLRLKSMAELTV